MNVNVKSSKYQNLIYQYFDKLVFFLKKLEI